MIFIHILNMVTLIICAETALRVRYYNKVSSYDGYISKSFDESIESFFGASISFGFFAIPATIVVLAEADWREAFLSFNPWVLGIGILSLCFVIWRWLRVFRSKYYVDLKKKALYNEKLQSIRNLIDDLERRKTTLTSYDKFDKYRSEAVMKEEVDDIEKSINLLQKMYSYLELNSSTAKVNSAYKAFESSSIEESELKKFEKELDTINARRDLEKNIDSTIEELKKKYQ